MKYWRFDGFEKLKFDVKNEYTDTKQSPTNLGLSFEVVNCLVVFPTYFNPYNSLLIIRQISLQFMYTPALRGLVDSELFPSSMIHESNIVLYRKRGSFFYLDQESW